MYRFARWTAIALAASLALAIPATSHAQFGGLKKKLKDKISTDSQPAATGNAADADAKARKEAWDHPVAISSATLDAFTKGIKAEQAERARSAATAGSPIGRWNAYLAAKAKCDADKANADTALLKVQQKMMAEATAGHAAAITALNDSLQKLVASNGTIQQRCNSMQKPTFTSEEFAAVHAEEDKEDAAGAAASGMSPLAYARLKERVVAYVLMPNGWKANGYSADETQTLDAHKAELKKLSSEYESSGYRKALGN